MNSPTCRLLVIAFAFAALGTWRIVIRSPTRVNSAVDRSVPEHETLQFTLSVARDSQNPKDLRFEMESGPPGATLDAQTGEFLWTPGEAQGPGRFPVEVRVVSKSSFGVVSIARFQISVEERNQAPELEPILDRVANLDAPSTLEIPLVARDRDLPSQPLRYHLLEASPGMTLPYSQGILVFDPSKARPGDTIRGRVAVADSYGVMSETREFRILCVGGSSPRAETPQLVATTSGERIARPEREDAKAAKVDSEVVPAVAVRPSTERKPAEPPRFAATLAARYRDKQLFDRVHYPALRQCFADEFRRENSDLSLRVDDDKTLPSWLEAHAEPRDEIFTAVDPRPLEMRPTTDGATVRAHRHADLLLRTYPILGDELNFSAAERAAFLRETLGICEAHQETWRELARLAATDSTTPAAREILASTIDLLHATFSPQPDLACEVIEPLANCEPDVRRRLELYEQLLSACDSSGRPDLSCRIARTMADEMTEAGRTDEANRLLVAVALRHADAPQVGALVDRLDALGADSMRVAFYRQFLPRISGERSATARDHVEAMHQRGIACYKKAGETALAADAERELQRLRAR